MSSARALMNGRAKWARMKMRGERPGARAGAPPLPPEIEIFSDTLKIGILIYSIREWMFHLV